MTAYEPRRWFRLLTAAVVMLILAPRGVAEQGAAIEFRIGLDSATPATVSADLGVILDAVVETRPEWFEIVPAGAKADMYVRVQQQDSNSQGAERGFVRLQLVDDDKSVLDTKDLSSLGAISSPLSSMLERQYVLKTLTQFVSDEIELHVDIVDAKGNATPWQDDLRFRLGEQFRLRVSSEEDAFLTAINVDPDGSVTFIVDNTKLKAGDPTTIPEDDMLTVYEPVGPEYIKLIASSTPLKLDPSAAGITRGAQQMVATRRIGTRDVRYQTHE